MKNSDKLKNLLITIPGCDYLTLTFFDQRGIIYLQKVFNSGNRVLGG